VAITGVELSPAILDLARKRAAELGLDVSGVMLLLDHIGSSWWPIWAVQRLVEQFTIRTAGEYMTRRQLPLVRAAGFEIVETQRVKAGTVERIAARRAT
jgi:hypothetical protein